jgi:hypothetical protein
LDRSTLADWVGESSRLLTALLDAVRRYVLAASKPPADDTPVPAPGTSKTKTGRRWTYCSETPRLVWTGRRGGNTRGSLTSECRCCPE